MEKTKSFADFVEDDVRNRASVEVCIFATDIGENLWEGLAVLFIKTFGPSSTQATLLQGGEMKQRDEMSEDASDVAPLATI